MVQAGSFLGRSILTPKTAPKPTARPTGNWQLPSRREEGHSQQRERSSLEDPQSQPGLSQEISQETLRVNRQNATSSNRVRSSPVQPTQRQIPTGTLFTEAQAAQPAQQERTHHAAESRPTQQERASRQNATEAQLTQQKRTANLDSKAEDTPVERRDSTKLIITETHASKTSSPPLKRNAGTPSSRSSRHGESRTPH